MREVFAYSMKQEPVSTTQVSSGRLESRRALKGMKSSGWPHWRRCPTWTWIARFSSRRSTHSWTERKFNGQPSPGRPTVSWVNRCSTDAPLTVERFADMGFTISVTSLTNTVTNFNVTGGEICSDKFWSPNLHTLLKLILWEKSMFVFSCIFLM